MSLEGKTAIVSGASSGIGASVVRDLRELGVRVAGGARRVERIDADVALELDVTDAESCERFVESAVDILGGLDILFNNAGLALGRYPVNESTEEDEATVIATCNQQGRSVFAYLEAAVSAWFQGDESPSLLPQES